MKQQKVKVVSTDDFSRLERFFRDYGRLIRRLSLPSLASAPVSLFHLQHEPDLKHSTRLEQGTLRWEDEADQRTWKTLHLTLSLAHNFCSHLEELLVCSHTLDTLRSVFPKLAQKLHDDVTSLLESLFARLSIVHFCPIYDFGLFALLSCCRSTLVHLTLSESVQGESYASRATRESRMHQRNLALPLVDLHNLESFTLYGNSHILDDLLAFSNYHEDHNLRLWPALRKLEINFGKHDPLDRSNRRFILHFSSTLQHLTLRVDPHVIDEDDEPIPLFARPFPNLRSLTLQHLVGSLALDPSAPSVPLPPIETLVIEAQEPSSLPIIPRRHISPLNFRSPSPSLERVCSDADCNGCEKHEDLKEVYEEEDACYGAQDDDLYTRDEAIFDFPSLLTPLLSTLRTFVFKPTFKLSEEATLLLSTFCRNSGIDCSLPLSSSWSSFQDIWTLGDFNPKTRFKLSKRKMRGRARIAATLNSVGVSEQDVRVHRAEELKKALSFAQGLVDRITLEEDLKEADYLACALRQLYPRMQREGVI